MPLRVTDQKPWCWTPRVCVGHAGQVKGLYLASTPGALEWELPPSVRLASSTAGADELRLGARPRLVYLAGQPQHITSEPIGNLEHPPQRHVRKKLASRPDRDSRLQFEWIALGLTERSFWTVRWRWISGLESGARFRVEGWTGPGSIESAWVFSRSALRAAKRN